MAHDILVVTEADLRGAVTLDLTAVDVVEKAFAALATGSVVMPPILSMAIPEANGEVDVKTAYIPGFDGFAIKVSPGFFDNPALGLPSLSGLMILFSARTGLVEALFLDNGYLTDIRTAAAGAVAARHMAPEEVTTAGVLGTGVQARLQIKAARLVRPFSRVLVWGRDPVKAADYATDLAADLGIEVRAVDDPAKLVAESQLVVTTTPAREPILSADWLHPGLHITAMGSDQGEKNEIDPRALVAADAYICDRLSQCEALGELRSAIAAGLWTGSMPAELGAVVSGEVVARKKPSDVTICDLTGTGAQDTAIATHARAVALASSIGTGISA
ncbi:ornithine cyclodeaminase [Rhodobium orientis]|uniref:Cyclodeaminase n=1 Tax=Rhodobium orientis TaxID=34017 RepID=A0A327JGF6_9HYPH|nr:cyclodeaminase [Rhodobium orientis]MBB4305433.1 ornithine cyclodeaminase [Rhodobium orientis]MBK5948342.1 cyclodeaminase [Rhodobium orientis]RAI25490.1 cyclodeaminase [Rhodobium orientis]